MTRKTILALILAALAACADNKKDYDAMARCEGLGYQPGTVELDKCVREEQAIRLMEQQRNDFERQKQEERDWKMRNRYQ